MICNIKRFLSYSERLFLGSLTKWLFLGFLPGLFQQIVAIIFMYYRDIAGFELAIHKSRFANQICFLCGSLQAVFVKFTNQNFLSVGIFVFREITKFLFTLQAWQIPYILLQIVLNCILFSCIWIAFWPQTPNWGLQDSPIPSNCWNFSLNYCGSLLKR